VTLAAVSPYGGWVSPPGPRIVAVESTELFVGAPEAPDQVLRVALAEATGRVLVRVAGHQASSPTSAAVDLTGAPVTVEVPVRVAAGVRVGAELPVTVVAVTADGAGEASSQARAEATFTVAEPGWTMHLVSHFHYDPVWWNTQAAYTASWDALDWAGSPRMSFQHAGMDLVRAHLEVARHDPDYRFVLAETDYLKPYWDSCPADRGYLRRLVAEGRCELMGGTYNEPNTNLTAAETTIRNLVYGVGFQREVLGGDPATAWQLDAFGHDPQFPGLAADAGLTSSSWARGPFHQWGPLQTRPSEPMRDARVMQFPSEFEWVAPSGRGLLTSYMPAHYSAGWWMDSAATLAEAEQAVYSLFRTLKAVAATRNVLLPVGTDYSPPNKWVTEIHRDWARRYVWPRFVCALPRDFFAAVRAELAATGRAPVPQTRDMNPIYTGKDVSFVDTKRAQRQAEGLLADAERFSTFAAMHGAPYPAAALDKAWRQLVYGAHHDGITGSESDQVYIDLLTGWREAWELARDARDSAVRHLAARVRPPVSGDGGIPLIVVNGASWPRTDLVRVRVAPPFTAPGLSVVDEAGTPVPFLAEGVMSRPGGGAAEATLTFLARDVPATGWRSYRLLPATEPIGRHGWQSPREDTPRVAPGQHREPGVGSISNAHYRLTVDPARGGSVSGLTDLDTHRDLLPPGQVGNELLVYDEYAQHPRYGEGPWHLLPTGPPRAGSADRPAEVRVEVCPIGARVVARGRLESVAYTQEARLWAGLRRVDCVTHVDEFTGADQLVRLRWPTSVHGGLPVSEVGDAVIGRGFGIVDVDTAVMPWTLDNPAYTWFGVGSTARVVLSDPDAPDPVRRAVGVAEVIADERLAADPAVRDLVVALVRAGVTSTTALDTGSRCGLLDIDSNLPDVRIALGGPERNAFTAAVLAAVRPEYTAELRRQVAESGQARVWVPAERPLAGVWGPDADLRGVRTLPVLVVAGRDDAGLHAALADLETDLADATVQVRQPSRLHDAEPGLDDYSVALVNRGVPGFAVDPTGALHLSLLRSCTGWPSAVWIDPPRRCAPDGSGFQLQHWTQSFEYALVSGPGDWRSAGFVHSGHDYNAPLTAVLAEPDPAGGASTGPALPAAGSLLTVDPPGAAVVTALKPAGNPLARGSVATASPRGGIAVRLYEPHGRPATVRVRAAVPVREAFAADLLEEAGDPLPVDADGAFTVQLGGCQVATALAVPAGMPGAPEPAEVPAAGAVEPVQPVYARYWLHNTGPAPTGGLPITVHATPTVVDGGKPVELGVTVASDLTDADWTGLLRVTAGAGWTVTPSEWPVALGPGEFAELAVRAVVPAGAPAGDHLVAVSVEHAGQLVEDVVTVSVPGPPGGSVSRGQISVLLDTPAVTVRPGGRAVLRAVLENRFRSPVHAVAHLVGPVDTWELIPRRVAGVRLDADDTARLDFPVVVPADARPGSWWLLVKVMYAGQVGYTDSVRLTVDPPRR
jgi:alpha-mannosidase